MVIKNLYREEETQNIKRIRQGARGVVIEYRAGCPYILLQAGQPTRLPVICSIPSSLQERL